LLCRSLCNSWLQKRMIPRGHGCTLSRDLVLARRRAELRRSAAEDRDRQSAAEICISGTSSREQQTSRREKAIPLSHQIISIYDISTICRLSELQAATELGAEDAHAWVKCADPYARRCFARERQTCLPSSRERAPNLLRTCPGGNCIGTGWSLHFPASRKAL